MQQEPRVVELLRKAAEVYLGELAGNYCQCATPDVGGRLSSICFACGRVNREAASAVEEYRNSPHVYEELDDPFLNDHTCIVCGQAEDYTLHYLPPQEEQA